MINFLKQNPDILSLLWKIAGKALKVYSLFVPIQEKTILFASFGGRKFDDSPKALYDEICRREEFKDWKLLWAFVDPEQFEIPCGEKIRIDTVPFFKALVSSKVQISNSGMTRGIHFYRKGILRVETWHGTPLKKIGGEENTGSMISRKHRGKRKNSYSYVIRCAQSEYDREIFARISGLKESNFLLCDLPRNDSLMTYSTQTLTQIREKLKIPSSKRVILYTPTYREYLIDEHRETYIAPPMNLKKWENCLGSRYVLLIRAHYAVNKALNLRENDFVRDVSSYPVLNDLYAIADLMISDYSSTFFDYSILDRPMFCFAYDLEEYEEKRGLYLDIEKNLPCTIDKNEDDLIKHISEMNVSTYVERTKAFHKKFAPYAGKASKVIVDEIEKVISDR